jgi:hypothetical protein
VPCEAAVPVRVQPVPAVPHPLREAVARLLAPLLVPLVVVAHWGGEPAVPLALLRSRLSFSAAMASSTS